MSTKKQKKKRQANKIKKKKDSNPPAPKNSKNGAFSFTGCAGANLLLLFLFENIIFLPIFNNMNLD